MEETNITGVTNITGTTIVGGAPDCTVTAPYTTTDRITINGDLYRIPSGAEFISTVGDVYNYTDVYLAEKLRSLEERIERIEEALMIESAKEFDSLIENDSGGEE